MIEETDEEFQARLRSFSVKLGALVDAESNQDGLASCIAGYGVGWALGCGASEQEVRDMFEQVLKRTLAQRMAMTRKRGDA